MFNAKNSSDVYRNEIDDKLRTALMTYQQMSCLEAYVSLKKIAKEIEDSEYCNSFQKQLGQLYYKIAIVLYNIDKNKFFHQIKEYFYQAKSFGYQNAEEYAKRMSQSRDPFSGEIVCEIPLLDLRGHVDLEKYCDEPNPFVKGLNIAQKESEICRHENAKSLYEDISSLEKIIEKDIFPCVFHIETLGKIGTGFMKFENWLISNAHVLPNQSSVLDASIKINSDNSKLKLGDHGSFHRKYEEAPDVSIVNISGAMKCLPFNEFSLDIVLEGWYYFFCVYIDLKSGYKKIGYLSPCEKSALCSTFKCVQNFNPEPGISGAPVFMARLSMTNQPSWQLVNIGALFARSVFEEGGYLAHIVRLDFDLQQLYREILVPIDESARLTNMSLASNENRDKESVDEFKLGSQQIKEIAKKGFIKYSSETNLIVDLPKGLERLVYTDEELLQKSTRQAQGLNREDRERRERLLRSEKKTREDFLERLQKKTETTEEPFTENFGANHVSEKYTESLKSAQDRVSEERSYASHSGEKKSTVMQMDKRDGRQELNNIASSLQPDDLIKTEDGYQIKKGIYHTTKQSYAMSNTTLTFGSRGNRKIDKDYLKTNQQVDVAVKIEGEELKISHLERPKTPPKN